MDLHCPEALPTLDADPQDHLSLHQPLAVPTGEAIGHELPQLPELCFCANGHELPHPQSDMSNPAVGGSSMKRSRTSSKKICKTRTTRTSNKTRHSECIVVSGVTDRWSSRKSNHWQPSPRRVKPLVVQPLADESRSAYIRQRLSCWRGKVYIGGNCHICAHKLWMM